MTDRDVSAATSIPVTVQVPSGDGGSTPVAWRVAAETPVQVCVNGAPFTVLFATPDDLVDLALGVLLTEQVIHETHALLYYVGQVALGEARIDLHFDEGSVNPERMQARTIAGNSACGLCGIESLAQLQDRVRRSDVARGEVPDRAVRAALRALPALQPLNALTRSVHAAAWCAPDGTVQLVREDVGRHNALDKLVGALAQAERLREPGFVLMSSRCSYELVAKTSFTNAQLLATISAPTSMALQWARTLELPLASGIRRGDDWAVVRFDDDTAAATPAIPL